MKDKDNIASHHLKVHAFLIIERVGDSQEFLVSVLLQVDRQFIGKASLGTVAEGQEVMLSLRWDQPTQRFVASSQLAGNVPILSFVPFASPVAADASLPPDFSMSKSFVVNSAKKNVSEAHENKN